MKRRRAAKRSKRSAIVPAVVFAAGLSVAAGVVPNIDGCSDDTMILGVAAQFGDMDHQVGLFDVAARAFDMAVADLSETD
jgi:hypothetical protein